MNDLYELLLCIAASYGLITMITGYDGAFGIFAKLRRFKLFRCGICLAPWISLMFIGYLSGLEYFALVGALVIAENRI